MIQWLIMRRLAAEEKKLGVSLDYLRHIARTSLVAFFKFGMIMPLATHRRSLPAAPYYVARLVAAQHEDCGTCVQIEVNLARQDGVPPEVLRAVIEGRPEELPVELRDVHAFARAVVEINGEEDVLRRKVRGHYREEGLVEMSLAIAAARVFPTTKRGLDYVRSCRAVEVKV